MRSSGCMSEVELESSFEAVGRQRGELKALTSLLITLRVLYLANLLIFSS